MTKTFLQEAQSFKGPIPMQLYCLTDWECSKKILTGSSETPAIFKMRLLSILNWSNRELHLEQKWTEKFNFVSLIQTRCKRMHRNATDETKKCHLKIRIQFWYDSGKMRLPAARSCRRWRTWPCPRSSAARRGSEQHRVAKRSSPAVLLLTTSRDRSLKDMECYTTAVC